MKKFLTISDIEKILKKHSSTIGRMIKAGKFPKGKVTVTREPESGAFTRCRIKERLWLKGDIDKWVEENLFK